MPSIQLKQLIKSLEEYNKTSKSKSEPEALLGKLKRLLVLNERGQSNKVTLIGAINLLEAAKEKTKDKNFASFIEENIKKIKLVELIEEVDKEYRSGKEIKDISEVLFSKDELDKRMILFDLMIGDNPDLIKSFQGKELQGTKLSNSITMMINYAEKDFKKHGPILGRFLCAEVKLDKNSVIQRLEAIRDSASKSELKTAVSAWFDTDPNLSRLSPTEIARCFNIEMRGKMSEYLPPIQPAIEEHIPRDVAYIVSEGYLGIDRRIDYNKQHFFQPKSEEKPICANNQNVLRK